jgi:flagellar protein FliS
MDLSPRDSYLETQVNTATPQRLRLMLIGGARWQTRAAQAAWQEDRPEAATEALVRCRDIVAELLSGIHEDGSPLVQQTLGIYAFLYSSLTELQQTRDPHQLAGIVRVLEEEQETWEEVCQRLPHRVVANDRPAKTEELAPQVVAGIQPSYAGAFASPGSSAASLSIEA